MELSTQIDDQITRQHLVPALRAFLQARDLCPLLPEPQRFLADNVEELEQADKRSAYLERATLVVPYDPGLWYVQGEELLERQPDQAWKKWRWSLELSDLYLAPILEHCTQRLDPQEILDRVLPAEPSILLAAALQLYPEPTEQRELFLGRALALLEKRSAPVSARDLRVKASIYAALGQSDETLRAYQAALALEPRAVTWRFEYARLLQEQRCLQQARRELLTVLSQQPEHAPAHELLAIVERQIAEGL